jgi:cytochrome c oxidase subunit 1
MDIYDSDGIPPLEPGPESWDGDSRGLLRRYLFSIDHKIIGLQYLCLALLCVFLGMGMSLLMRVHLLWPAAGWNFLGAVGDTPERYAVLTLLHGSLMVFFVLTAAPQAGFGNYFLPLQIGARETAFPNLNRAAVWLTCAALLGIAASFLLPAARGVQLWVVSVAVFCLASLLVAVNFSVTAMELRGRGMTLPRLPVTVWAWFINALLSILIFSILLAACVLLLTDAWLGTGFFPGAAIGHGAGNSGVAVANWQRLFWFFAQAEVYVAILPCFGIVTHLLAMFARRPVWKERAVVLALCGVGLFGFCIWGEHVFATGMNPGLPMHFGVLASSLGVPASVLLLSWFAMLWNGRMVWNTSALFVLGFISLFLSGSFSGLFLSRDDMGLLAGGDFISGHFHLVLGVTATFAILAALFFWFPKLFARRLNEPLGKLHFWLTFVGVYCVFMPMHWMGLVARARPGENSALAASHAGGLNAFITAAALLTVAAQGIFLLNLVATLWRGEVVLECNPWRATTLEWMDEVQEFAAGGARARVFRGAYDFDESGGLDDFIPQYVAPEHVARRQVSRSR